MSRTIRLLVAGAALAGVVAPLSTASADPEPVCRFYWGEPLLTTTPGFPVQVVVYRPAYAC